MEHTWHCGRSWTGHLIEDHCPCPQEPCGLVNITNAAPSCEHHPVGKYKTMRQGHRATDCTPSNS